MHVTIITTQPSTKSQLCSQNSPFFFKEKNNHVQTHYSIQVKQIDNWLSTPSQPWTEGYIKATQKRDQKGRSKKIFRYLHHTLQVNSRTCHSWTTHSNFNLSFLCTLKLARRWVWTTSSCFITEQAWKPIVSPIVNSLKSGFFESLKLKACQLLLLDSLFIVLWRDITRFQTLSISCH